MYLPKDKCKWIWGEVDMIIIAFDDDKQALNDLIETVKRVDSNSSIHAFQSSDDVLAFASKNKADIAFLDIKSKEMNGIELAKKLKELQKNLNIIFVTGYSEYALNALSLHASGYILKPVSGEKIIDQLNNLRNPVVEKYPQKLRIQTFGNFQVYYQGKPVHFARSKAKELFAYLIHKRGSGCSSKEIAAILFQDKPYDKSIRNQIQTIISSLTKTLSEIGMKDVLIKEFNSIAISVEKVHCDYYDFLHGNLQAINSYSGEYMTNYDWAEFIIGYLDQKFGLNN